MEKKVGHALVATANMLRRSVHPSEDRKRLQPRTAMQHFFIGEIYMSYKQGKDIYQKDLEAEFSVRRSTASGILAIMEENGLIKREISEHDARLKRLVLTEQGLELCKHHDEKIDALEERISRGLTPDEIDFLLDILERIQKNIDRNNDWRKKI